MVMDWFFVRKTPSYGELLTKVKTELLENYWKIRFNFVLKELKRTPRKNLSNFNEGMILLSKLVRKRKALEEEIFSLEIELKDTKNRINKLETDLFIPTYRTVLFLDVSETPYYVDGEKYTSYRIKQNFRMTVFVVLGFFTISALLF